MKRLFDVVVSFTALLVLFPVLSLIYITVFLSSPGGGFFRQTRIGQHGKPFFILKFRTMSVKKDAESGSFDAGDSSRITAIGRVLRSTKLDELPQFINVLKGDMAIVGPRPEVRQWVEAYPERWANVHQVKPGITDPASIEFRDEEAVLSKFDDPVKAYRDKVLPRKLDLYEQYVRDQSFLNDIKIMCQTLIKVLGK